MKKKGYKEIKRKETIYYEIEDEQKDLTKQEKDFIDKEKQTIAYMYINSTYIDTVHVQKCLAEMAITEYAYRNNLEISEYYIDCVPDEINGNNKICLDKVLKLIEKGKIGQIIVDDIDHISKASRSFKTILDKVSENNVKILCCKGNWVFG